MSTAVGNQTGRARLPVQSRDRRPALAALALLLIVGGGLGAGLIVYRTGQQTDVLVAGRTIHQGDTLTSDDVTTSRVSGADDNTIAAGNQHSFVGTVATTTIPRGSLLNRLMFHTKKGLVPSGGQTLGISVPATQRPSLQFAAGDVVQAYYVVKNNSSSDTTAPTANKIAYPLLVTGVQSSQTGDGSSVISVLVNADTAQQLAIPASQGNVTLTRLAYGVRPELSLVGS